MTKYLPLIWIANIAIYINLVTKIDAVKFSFRRYPPERGTFIWDGCLFKTAKSMKYFTDPECAHCVQKGTTLAKNTDKYFMRYINCSMECPYPTLCTEYKFNFGGDWRPECFICEAKSHENVVYRALPMSDLCGKECADCASEADLSSSLSCSIPCHGKPTFCPERVPRFFGQRLCYQAKKQHGCKFKEVSRGTLERKYGRRCEACALQVGPKHADICSHHCGHLPTYHGAVVVEKIPPSDNDDSADDYDDYDDTGSSKPTVPSLKENHNVFLQCEVLKYLGPILEYEIPIKIRQLLNDPTNNSILLLNLKHGKGRVRDEPEEEDVQEELESRKLFYTPNP